jgi:Polyketide cyclase / dehydrase and lipid transport
MRMVDSVEINRPASQVWAYVADYGNDTGWRAGVSLMRPSIPGPAQVGVTTHEALRLLGMTFLTDATIYRVEPGRLLEWQARDRQKHLQGSRLVEPLARAGPASPRRWSFACWGCCGRLGRWWAGCCGGRPPLTCSAFSRSWRRQWVVGHPRAAPRPKARSDLLH